ncbi:MAG: DNA translocase FtsK [Anaerolineales bacterium]|nr:DNA translocase FtsK [Anaerolineales bacterium]
MTKSSTSRSGASRSSSSKSGAGRSSTGKTRGKQAQPPPERRVDWGAVFTSPLFQQILALVVIALGLITFLALIEVTNGRWADAWGGLLRRLLGWGAYPVSVMITLGGMLWLQHLLDRPVKWRWRPVVGMELVFFSLLGLTHIIAGRQDPWALMEAGWGGGLIGWAISTVLTKYIGWIGGIVILAGIVLLGTGLAFDVTVDDVKQFVQQMRGHQPAQAAPRPTASAPKVNAPPQRQRTRPPEPEAPPPLIPTASSPRSAARPTTMSLPQSAAPQASASPPRPAQPPAAATVAPPPVPAPQSAGPAQPPAPRPTEVMPKVVPMAAATAPPRAYSLPPLDLLDEPGEPAATQEEIREKSRIIESTLAQFGLPVEVAEVRVGPAVTQFGLRPGYVERAGASERKVRVNQISSLADDLALALAAPRLRVEAPVPGRPIVGIEVPNSQVQVVKLREVIETDVFSKHRGPLRFALGQDVAGEPVVADLSKMPHLLIAGTTGSGKSVCIKAITTCFVLNNTPEQLRMVLIDPKMVELVRFNGLPHVYGRVEVDLERIVKVLRWVAAEMDQRYRLFAAAAARNIDDYNRQMEQQDELRLPRIVVLIDELADLMMVAPDEVERTICRIAQMARATGIHLIVATQRPSVDVVTGLIKANFPARISFATASQTDSRVILDMPGAETLLGRGDMLFLASDAGHPVRVQGCFVGGGELDRVVEFWRNQSDSLEEEAPWERMVGSPTGAMDGEDAEFDPELLEQAIALVQSTKSASASLLQRRLRIGHPRAARLMEVMEEMGVIGPPVAAGRRRSVIIGGDDNGGNDEV